MDEKDKGKVVDFKPKEAQEIFIDEMPEEAELLFSQECDFPEDFIYNNRNVNIAITLVGIYKMLGLEDKVAVDAAFDFIDVYGQFIGLVPPMPEE